MRREPDPFGAARWSALLCAVLAALFWIGPYAFRVDIFNNDAAHHIFWLYQYADAGLFPDDLSIQYFHTSAPWGYRALYAMVAPVMDVLLAAELLSIILLGASLLLAWKIGKALGEPDRALHGLLAVVALIILLRWSGQKDLIPPIALQRTFAMPLILFTFWALVCRKYAWVGVSWVAAALFYPVVLPVQGLTAALVFLRDIFRDRAMPPRWMLNGAAGLAALTIATLGTQIPPEIGPAFTYEQAMRMPEFGPHGRLVMYQDSWAGNWLRGHRTGLGWSPYVLLAMGSAVGLVWVLGRIRSIPFAAWAMLGVGVGLWGAMRLFPEELMFGLYLPNRHSRWALGVFGMIAIATAVAAAIQHGTTGPGLRRGVTVLAPLAVAAIFAPWAATLLNRPVDRDLEKAYVFIKTLPRSTLVAAHPDLADFVPVRSRRSVLVSTENSMAWMENYYKQMKPRLEASLRAAYATRINEMDCALAPYGVDVMLTGPSVWSRVGYFAPFDDLAKDLQRQGAKYGFVLQAPPQDRIMFRSGQYYVIRVESCAG
jgi:hypothetical protein